MAEGSGTEKPAASRSAPDEAAGLGHLNDRTRDVFREIVEAFLETGAPVGSRTLSKRLNGKLSAASIRNVMSDLEVANMLFSPHTSAGRQPTDLGIRMFVDGLMQIGDLTDDERAGIEGRCRDIGRSMDDVLTEASEMLSGLSGWAGMVVAAKSESPLKHVEFVALGDGRALVVMVSAAGSVENRILELPPGVTQSTLAEASNYLNARLQGRTFGQAYQDIMQEIEQRRAELDQLSARVVASGLAIWSGDERPTLIVRGRANLFDDTTLVADLERIRQLFEDLDNKRALSNLLNASEEAEGVRIFIGSESQLFSLSGSSVIVAPYQDSRQQVVGAIGVVGPTYLDYARIIPMVDFTAKVIGRIVG